MAGLEPTISWLRVQYHNHSAIRPSAETLTSLKIQLSKPIGPDWLLRDRASMIGPLFALYSTAPSEKDTGIAQPYRET